MIPTSRTDPVVTETAFHHRPVDLDAPAYREGVDFANRMLDMGHLSADELIAWAELGAKIAHADENERGYLRSRGFGDTIRDYQQDRSDT